LVIELLTRIGLVYEVGLEKTGPGDFLDGQ